MFRECIAQGIFIRNSCLFCENFESSIYISSLTCGVSLCRVHQNGFTRIHRVILKCDFNDRCDS